MSQKIILLIVIIVLLFAGYYYWQSTNTNNVKLSDESKKEQEVKKSYINLSTTELANMLSRKDFKLIDVHIPEQRHIPGTDKFIPFNEINKIITALPDKNEKIVLYCRSGSMSEQVAKELIAQGYTNVYNLTGGLNKWTTEDRKTLPQKSLTY